MKFEHSLDSTEYLKEVSTKTTEFLSSDELKAIPTLGSGVFKCVIVRATRAFYTIKGETITRARCTCVAFNGDKYSKDCIIGKFDTTFDLEPNSKFFFRTQQIAYLTDNKTGIDEREVTRKQNIDGVDVEMPVADSNGVQLVSYDCLCFKPFIVTLYRKPQDYINASGVAYAQHTIKGMFTMDKKSVREDIISKQNGIDGVKYYECQKSYTALVKQVKEENGTLQDPTKTKCVEFAQKTPNTQVLDVPKEATKVTPPKAQEPEEPEMAEEELEDIPF